MNLRECDSYNSSLNISIVQRWQSPYFVLIGHFTEFSSFFIINEELQFPIVELIEYALPIQGANDERKVFGRFVGLICN